MKDTDKNIDRIIDEAANWFVVMESDDATNKDKTDFARWLNTSPVHAREYAEVSGLWDETGIYGSELEENRSVVRLFPGQKTTRQKHIRPNRFLRRGRKIAASLIVGFLLAASAVYVMYDTDAEIKIAKAETFETRKGENHRFPLQDGSFVELNTNSLIEVKYSDKLREIRLVRGEAFFDVAKNKFKPFIVDVGTTHVRALGTRFNINKRQEKIEVTVLEGKVRVSKQREGKTSPARLDWVADLGAGEQIVTLVHEPTEQFQRPANLNLKAVLSWRENKLVFDHRDLMDVVEDFNRHNDQLIVLVDSALNRIKISGTFNPSDPESFVQSMKGLAEIRSETTDDGRILLHRAQ